jgi:hypothetical protein
MSEQEKQVNPIQENLEIAFRAAEELLHQLRLSYDIKPQKPLSDLIITQESALRELKNLLQ